jgi:hypothetical protein
VVCAAARKGHRPSRRRTLTDIHEKLCKPFVLWAIEVKLGATTQDKTRLDRLAGPEGWSVEYLPIGERAIRCRLTILGVVTPAEIPPASPVEVPVL